MHRYGTLLVIGLLLLARSGFAQEFGDLQVAQDLVDWSLTTVLIIVVEVALVGVLAYAVWQRDLVLFLVGFAVICIIGGVASFIPDIAEGLVGAS